MNWINNINTTNLRICVSLILATLYVFVVIGGVLMGKPLQANVEVLDSLELFLGAMLGIDAAQFIGKRFSDSGYAAAKAQQPQVVPAPSQVVMPSPTPAAPTSQVITADLSQKGG